MLLGIPAVLAAFLLWLATGSVLAQDAFDALRSPPVRENPVKQGLSLMVGTPQEDAVRLDREINK